MSESTSTITDTPALAPHPRILMKLLSPDGNVVAQINLDGSWTVDWDTINKWRYNTGITGAAIGVRAWAALFLAAKDNFLEISFEQAAKIAVNAELQDRINQAERSE